MHITTMNYNAHSIKIFKLIHESSKIKFFTPPPYTHKKKNNQPTRLKSLESERLSFPHEKFTYI